MLNVPEPSALDAAMSIWQYHCLEEDIPQDIIPVDFIVGLGTYDVRVAERCAELHQKALSDKIIFTGGFGRLTKDIFKKTEAQAFCDMAIKLGVPKESILLEEQATNTGENIQYVKDMFPDAKSAIFVATPQMQRRCRATLEKLWPELKAFVTGPNIHLISQATNDIDIEKVIHEVVGNYWRIKTYPRRGFQVEQQPNDAAESAFNLLIKQGYTKHLPDNWQEELEEACVLEELEEQA